MSETIKILYLSSLHWATTLDVDKEFRTIYEKFCQDPATGNNFSAVSVSNLRAADLQAVILKNAPEIIHFAGHSSLDEIFFEEVYGKVKEVSKIALVNFLKILPKKPTIIFFNSCESAELLKRLKRIIDFVVVTRDEVDDDVAVLFAAKFYEFLATGQTVKTAFDFAKSYFELDGRKEAAEMYRLLIRSEDKSLRFSETNNEKDEIIDPARTGNTTSNIFAKTALGIITVGKVNTLHQHIRQDEKE
jgi:hypothetical protein